MIRLTDRLRLVLADSPEDAAELSSILEKIDIRSFVDILDADDDELRDLAELRDVVVLVGADAGPAAHARARDAVGRLRGVADEVLTVAYPGKRFAWPEGIDTIGSALAWLRGLPPLPPRGVASSNGQHTAPQAAGKPWPPLRRRERVEAPPFPANVFPAPLEHYCLEAAASLQAPADFVGSAMLAVAGAAIGQSVNVAPKRDWREIPALYVVLVGPPGSAKTPVIQRVRLPLLNVDMTMRRESALAREAWDSAKQAHTRDPKQNPPPGPPPPERRLVVRDITRESLAVILRDNPRGVLCDPDEASAWVGSFNEYKTKGGSDRQFWLSLWSCVPISVDRKNGRESTNVPYPFAAVLGGIPPGMLGCLSEERGRDDGLLDRLLFCFPDPDDYPPQRWSGRELPEDVERDWIDVLTRLVHVPMTTDDGDETPRPWVVNLTRGALRVWAEWFDAQQGETRDPDFPEGLTGVWSKMKAHALRFALILSRLRLACDPTADARGGAVDVADVRGALALAEYFKGQARRVRRESSGGLEGRDARRVLEWVERHRPATFRAADVGADLRRFRDNPRALDEALRELTSAGYIRPVDEPQRSGPGRRPTPLHEVHPELLQAPENPVITEKPPAEPVGSTISGKNGIAWRSEDEGGWLE